MKESPDEPPESESTSQPLWIVRGHDTFAREDYFIGAYETRAEAEAVKRAKERRLAEFQDEALRDEVWIVAPQGEAGA